MCDILLGKTFVLAVENPVSCNLELLHSETCILINLIRQLTKKDVSVETEIAK